MPTLMPMRNDPLRVYQTILLDPPWPERGGGGRGAQNHYPVITKKEDIEKEIIESGIFKPHDNAHMYMWVTNNYLIWGLWLMNRLGFTYKTMLTWSKTRFGTGYYFFGQTEHCLFGVRGTLAPRNKCKYTTLLDVEDDPSRKKNSHSVKPDDMYEVINHVSHGPKLEMFCRRPEPGFDSWGKDNGLGGVLAPGSVLRRGIGSDDIEVVDIRR